MHESVLMSKPVSSLILLIVFVKCLWAPGVPLIPSAKGDPSASGEKLFTCNGHFYPWAGVQDQSSVWCCTWANAPSRLPPTLSHGFGAQPGPSCPRKALAGFSAALEPERAQGVAIHSLLSQLTGTIWADHFIFISLRVCCRWQCPETGDISGDSLENIRKL